MLIKALVTSPAFALGMTPCHTGLSGTYSKLFTFAPFLRPTTTRRTLSVGVATTIAFGGCSFSVLRTTGLVLFCNAVTVLPQPFSVDQIFHGMMEETSRLLMGLFGCTIKSLNVIFQQLTRTDLPKKDIP